MLGMLSQRPIGSYMRTMIEILRTHRKKIIQEGFGEHFPQRRLVRTFLRTFSKAVSRTLEVLRTLLRRSCCRMTPLVCTLKSRMIAITIQIHGDFEDTLRNHLFSDSISNKNSADLIVEV